MIPIIYNAGERLYDTWGIGPLAEISNPRVVEEGNGLFYFTFDYPASSEMYKHLKNQNKVVADASPELKNQVFVITRVTKPLRGMVSVYAEHISLYVTKNAGFLNKVNYNGNAQDALNAWQRALITEEEVYVSSDITMTSTGTWELEKVQHARKVLGGVEGSILDVYGGEYRFDNLRISLMKSRGENRGVQINWGKNLVDLVDEEDLNRVHTAIEPFAKLYVSEEDKKQMTDEQREEAENTVFWLPEQILLSEYSDLYHYQRVALVDLSNDNVTSIDDLRAKAYAYMDRNDFGKPKIDTKISHVDLSKTIEYQDIAEFEVIDLFDTVTVNVEKYGITGLTAKVIEVDYNPVLERYNEIRIGNTLSTRFQDNVGSVKQIEASQAERLAKIEREIIITQEMAGGGALIFRTEPNSSVTPIANNLGDTWYKKLGDGKTQIFVWNGIEWESILNLEELEYSIETAQSSAQTAIEEAEKANNEAIKAITGLEGLSDEVLEIDQKAQEAFTKAENAISEAENAITEAGKATAEAGTAIQRTDTAFSWLEGIDDNIFDIEHRLDPTMPDSLAYQVASHTSTIAEQGGRLETLRGDFDGLEIGGRNYWVNSLMWDVKNYERIGPYDYYEVTGLKPNTEYTMSINPDIDLDSIPNPSAGNRALRINNKKENPILNVLNILSDRVETFKRTVTSTEDGVLYILNYDILQNEIGDLNPKGIILKESSVIQDWSPAPEDLASSKEFNDYKQTSEGYFQRVQSIETDLASGVTYTKINDAQNTADRVESTLAQITDGDVTAYNQKISTAISNISTIQQDLDPNVDGSTGFRLNRTEETAGRIEQSLTEYAKTTDLNGLATETYATNVAIEEAGKVQSILAQITDGDVTAYNQKISTALGDIQTIKNADYATQISNIMQTSEGYFQRVQALETDLESGETYTKINNVAYMADRVESTLTQLTDGNVTAYNQKISTALGDIQAIKNADYATQISNVAGRINVQIVSNSDGSKSMMDMTSNQLLYKINGGLIQITKDKFYMDQTLIVPIIQATKLSATQIESGTLDANKANIINLNVANLVGENANLIRGSFNAINTSIAIDGTSLTTKGNWGGDIKLSNRGLTIHDNLANQEMGVLYGLYRNEDDPYKNQYMLATGLFANYGYKLNLGFRDAPNNTNYSIISLDMIDVDRFPQMNVFGDIMARYDIKMFGGMLTGAANAGYTVTEANGGHCFEFANGWKIQFWRSSYQTFPSGWTGWTFPKRFESIPRIVFAQAIRDDENLTLCNAYSLNYQACNIRIQNKTLQWTIVAMAIGR